MRLKMWITSLVLLICMIPIQPGLTRASDDFTYSVTISDASIYMNRDLTVTVYADNAVDLYGYELVLEYDNTKLKYKKANAPAGGITFAPKPSDNPLTLSHSKTGKDVPGDNGKVNLGEFIFESIAPGTTSVKLTRVIAVPHNPNDKKEKYWNGSTSVSTVIMGFIGSGSGSTSTPSGSSGSGGNVPAAGSQPTVSYAQDGVHISTPEPTKSKTKDGTSVIVISLTADSMTKALDTLQANQSKTNTIHIGASAQDGTGAVQVNIPGPSIAAALKQAKDTIVSVNLDGTVYRLPIQALDVQKWASSLGAEVKDLTVSVMIQTLNKPSADQMTDRAQKSGLKLLTQAVDFSVSTESGGKTVSIQDFGNMYVSRNIEIPSNLDRSKATGVMYNPATGEFTFVPTYFRTSNGKTEATLKRTGNSVYTVVEASKSFNDLEGHWAKEDVQLLASKLLVNGRTDSTFVPQGEITRAEFATLLVKGLGLSGDRTVKFSDVTSDAWYAEYVGAAAKAGLVEGLSDGSFAPNANITREQMAAMISRSLQFAGKQKPANMKNLDVFIDKSSVSTWAKEAAAQSIEAGIMNGTTSTLFNPSSPATRAEATVVLKRLLQYTEFIN